MELINSTEFDSCTEQPYVRAQLAIATMNKCRSYKLSCTKQPYVLLYTSSKQMKLASYRWYVRTQLAIATIKKALHEYCVRERFKRLTSKNDAKRIIKKKDSTKEMNECRSYKLACIGQTSRLSACEKGRKFNEAHIHTKVDLVSLEIIYCIYNSIKIIKLIIVKNYAYLLLTAFADPS